MTTVSFEKPRPKCRICGSRSHVITKANRRSPYLGCCALCGQLTAQLLDVLKVAGEQRLHQLVARAKEVNEGQLSIAEQAAAAV